MVVDVFLHFPASVNEIPLAETLNTFYYQPVFFTHFLILLNSHLYRPINSLVLNFLPSDSKADLLAENSKHLSLLICFARRL
jgi:hypothetical protein